MPHLILEHSDNLIKKTSFHALFRECHETLVRILPTELKGCKSRAIECTQSITWGMAHRIMPLFI